MNCKDYQELISAGFDEELSPSERARVDEHLKNCSECKIFAAQVEVTNARLLSWTLGNLPNQTEKSILSRAASNLSSNQVRNGFLQGHYAIPKKLTWAAMILLLLLFFNAGSQLFKTGTAEKRSISPASGPNKSQLILITEQDIVKTYSFYPTNFKF